MGITKLCWAITAVFLITFSGIGAADDASSDKILSLLYKAQEELANGGNVSSMFLLGTMYEEGTGVERNYKLALLWYKRAEEHGHTEATARIAGLTAKENSWPELKTDAAGMPARHPNATRPAPGKNSGQERAADKKQDEVERLKQEAAKVRQLQAQLQRQKAEAENARQLAEQLARERAAEAERARQQVEKARMMEEQLARERAAAETARREAELARLATENARGAGGGKATNESGVAQTANSDPAATEAKEFKANPCDTPAARFMSTCH